MALYDSPLYTTAFATQSKAKMKNFFRMLGFLIRSMGVAAVGGSRSSSLASGVSLSPEFVPLQAIPCLLRISTWNGRPIKKVVLNCFAAQRYLHFPQEIAGHRLPIDLRHTLDDHLRLVYPVLAEKPPR